MDAPLSFSLRDTLHARGVRLDPNGVTAAQQAIDAAMKAEGDRFANVLTIQDIASRVLRQASVRAQASPGGNAASASLAISSADFAALKRN